MHVSSTLWFIKSFHIYLISLIAMCTFYSHFNISQILGLISKSLCLVSVKKVLFTQKFSIISHFTRNQKMTFILDDCSFSWWNQHFKYKMASLSVVWESAQACVILNTPYQGDSMGLGQEITDKYFLNYLHQGVQQCWKMLVLS